MTGNRGWRVVAAVAAMSLVAGCGMFDGWFGGSSMPVGKLRPGADRAVAPSNALPPAAGGGGGEPVSPVDERGPAIGSVVPGKGGQKAQKEAAEKEAAERDAKARKERDEREATEKAARAAEKAAEKTSTVKPGTLPKPPAAEDSTTPAAVPLPAAEPAVPAAAPPPADPKT